MADKTPLTDAELALKKWAKKRGSLIMALHEIQNQRGFVPRDAALEIAKGMNVPLARIYEVITFYNYFKLESPGDVVISVCTGTACHLKGASEIVDAFKEELAVEVGETTEDGIFHLQSVRCVGCCGLAPVVVINSKTYGKVKPVDIKLIVEEWRELFPESKLAGGTK
jgi:NADH:ubiquinone oxidoreductase subunit E